MARTYNLYDDQENQDLIRQQLLGKMTSVAQPGTAPASTTAPTGIPTDPVQVTPDGGIVGSPNTSALPSGAQTSVEVSTDGSSPYEQGGVTGNGTAQTATIDPTTSTSKQYANMLQGFDSTKLADATHTTPKYTFARLAQNYAPTPEGLTAMAADPAFAAAGFKLVGTDKISLPNGEIIDVGLGFSSGGNQGWAWQPTTGPNGVALSDGTSAASSATSNNPFTSSTSSSTSSSSGGGDANLQSRVNALLMQLMGQDPSKVTSSDTYNTAVNAYDAQQQRAAERERAAIAERMDATGTSDSGAYDSALLKADQTRGENSSAFAANLALQEMDTQRNQIMQALQLSGSLLSDQQKMALTERLALLDAAIQREQMAQQNTQFNDQLGWDMSTWEYLANQGWLS